jgi:putative tryptophan/tyrosine transport system substrate-binding protein
MRRREVIAWLAATVAPLPGLAQSKRRVVLFVTAVRIPGSATLDILRGEMAQHGGISGQDVVVEAIFDVRELPSRLSKEMVDVIFATGPESVRAAVQATRSIPIVAFDLETDPVEAGYVASFARPGGNLTGIFLDQPELAGKWLQLITQVAPQVKRVAAVWDPGTGQSQRSAIDQAAAQLGLQLFIVALRPDLEDVFAEARGGGAEALVFLSSPLVSRQGAPLAELARKAGLPTISLFSEFARAGGLLAYGPSVMALRRRGAEYVAKILKGQLPSDIPIERPTTYGLIVNLRTASELRLTIPTIMLQIADEVIE